MPGWLDFLKNYQMPRPGSKDANEPEPPAAAPPGQPAPPGQTAQAPQFGGFWQPGPWQGIPFNQSYGGQPAPYGNLHDQIRNTMNMTEAGAGRFGSNAAARYGFQGGTQQWRPDANTPGQPISPYQYNPQFGMRGGGNMGFGGGGGYSLGGGMRTGGGDPSMRPPMQTGGGDPRQGLLGGGMPGVRPQPAPPSGAVGTKAGFTQPMMNLSSMDQNAVNQMMATAKDDPQRIAMATAFQSAQNPYADQFLNNLYGGDDARKAKQQQYLMANRSDLPVWDAQSNTFMSQQDSYAKQMGWK